MLNRHVPDSNLFPPNETKLVFRRGGRIMRYSAATRYATLRSETFSTVVQPGLIMFDSIISRVMWKRRCVYPSNGRTGDFPLWREINGRMPRARVGENLKMSYLFSLFFVFSAFRTQKLETFSYLPKIRFVSSNDLFMINKNKRGIFEIHRFIFPLVNSLRPREMVKGETGQDLNVGETSFQDLNHIGNEPRTRFRFTSICGLNAFCDHKPMDLDVHEAMAVSSFIV